MLAIPGLHFASYSQNIGTISPMWSALDLRMLRPWVALLIIKGFLGGEGNTTREVAQYEVPEMSGTDYNR
jgi:hypothetical protein